VQTWTVYDGASPDAPPYADFNGSGSLSVRYLVGPTVVNGAVTIGILARTSSGGTTAWYLADKLGSVRDVVDTSGSVIDHIVYDSFGNIVTETNASNGDRFKFAGMQYDAAIGQHFDNARWYGPTYGRFLSQDPAAFHAGDTNLYRYVFNGPTLGTDPSGMAVALPFEVVACGLLVGALVYYSVQYQMALGLSRQLDFRIQMEQAMRAMREAMVAQMAAGVAMAEAEIHNVEIWAWQRGIDLAREILLMGTGYIPPDMPPGKDPNEWWRKLVDEYNKIRKFQGRPPYDPGEPPYPPGGGPTSPLRPA
jgi:RHS repeat-associated protein